LPLPLGPVIPARSPEESLKSIPAASGALESHPTERLQTQTSSPEQHRSRPRTLRRNPVAFKRHFSLKLSVVSLRHREAAPIEAHRARIETDRLEFTTDRVRVGRRELSLGKTRILNSAA